MTGVTVCGLKKKKRHNTLQNIQRSHKQRPNQALAIAYIILEIAMLAHKPGWNVLQLLCHDLSETMQRATVRAILVLRKGINNQLGTNNLLGTNCNYASSVAKK